MYNETRGLVNNTVRYKMKVHLSWFLALVVLVSLTFFATYNFTREILFAATINLNTKEVKLLKDTYAELDKNKYSTVKFMLKGQVKLKETTIKNYTDIVENGYFYSISKPYTGKKSE